MMNKRGFLILLIGCVLTFMVACSDSGMKEDEGATEYSTKQKTEETKETEENKETVENQETDGNEEISGNTENNDNTEYTWKFSKNIARDINDDGWVYSFGYTYMKDGSDGDLIPFEFYGINIRYRYHDDYYEEITKVEAGEEVIERIPTPYLMLGGASSSGIKQDMEKVAEILDYKNCNVTREELLAINPEDVTFKELDKDMFFGLVDEALNGEAHPEGKYIELPTYALMTEPEYIDDYKFQIGFVSNMGTVDVIYIDVLYKTGEGYNEYIQLSDMIDDGTADDEQKDAFQLISDISKGIVEENNLIFAKDKNCNKVIGNIDFSRLYNFLQNIENYNYMMYLQEN